MKRSLLPLLLLACAPALAATWNPTADSTTSAPKFTDGNFVISWNAGNGQLKYESHDASVSTVCDMSTLSEDVDAVAGYSHPTQVAQKGFKEKSGITRVVLPEACYGINEQSFSSMADRARADYPTKLEDVMVKIRGPKFDLVPTKVKDSDVLGVTNGRSRWNNAGRPYYVVQWREAAPGTIILMK